MGFELISPNELFDRLSNPEDIPDTISSLVAGIATLACVIGGAMLGWTMGKEICMQWFGSVYNIAPFAGSIAGLSIGSAVSYVVCNILYYATKATIYVIGAAFLGIIALAIVKWLFSTV